MIIWRGWGILAFLLAVVFIGGSAGVHEAMGLSDDSIGLVMGIGVIITGVASWFLGQHMNKTLPARKLEAVRVGGVILNRVGSVVPPTSSTRELADVGLPVLGAVPSTADVAVPSRHLGLVPAAERDEAGAAIDAAGAVVAEHVDLTAVLELARTAPPLAAEPWSPEAVVSPVVGRPRIAVAGGRAFTFRYP